MEFATSNEEVNPYPYGSAEHLAFEMNRKFGGTLGAFVISLCFRAPGVSVSEFLDGVLTMYGVEEARYGAIYLDSFDTMPKLMDTTVEKIILMNLDFDGESGSE